MKKFKQLANGLTVSLAGNVAKASFRASLPSTPMDEATKKVMADASLYYDFKRSAIADKVDVPASRLVLSEDRYVLKDFRALSQSFLAARGLDFSVPGVLKAAVPLLFGKTIYPNHDFRDINNWVGVVAASSWDEAGASSNGVPGLNCQVKIDAFLNYRIACGVMMTPPAINAMSLTVLFEYEYSHPELAKENRWRFFDLLGEEVDGQIVRLIVTKIVDIWEASLVFLGEDRDAKSIDSDDEEGSDSDNPDDESLAAADPPPPNSNDEEKKNMLKLTKERKAELGIEFDGDEVPDDLVFKALDALSAKAKLSDLEPQQIADLSLKATAGETLLKAKREEVIALAKLAELGSKDGELNEVISGLITKAHAEDLIKLEKHYRDKVGEKFPDQRRSSLEDGEKIEGAGGAGDQAKTTPTKRSRLL